MNSISELRKIMTMNEYSKVYGTPDKEYSFEGLPVMIIKAGSKMCCNKSKPYTVKYKRLGKYFKTLVECLEYILSENYIYDNEMVVRASKDMNFHYNCNA